MSEVRGQSMLNFVEMGGRVSGKGRSFGGATPSAESRASSGECSYLGACCSIQEGTALFD